MVENNKCVTGVYCITNTINGKRYIGSSSRSIKRRIKQHNIDLRRGKHHSKHLQRAYYKYGPKSFVISVLEKCDPEMCLHREQYWLDKFETYLSSNGYNTSSIAGSRRGVKVSDESKEKMSRSASAHFTNPLERKRRSEIAKRRFLDQEQRDNLSNKVKELWKDPEHRERMCKAICKAAAERIISPETRKKLSEATTAYHKRRRESKSTNQSNIGEHK